MGLFFNKETPTNKIGRVRKCPQCGASVPSSKVICPECGWEFDDGNDRQSAVQKLAAELKKSQGILGGFTGKTEGDIIRTFPIPKTKNDLLELTIYFKTRKGNYAEVDNRRCKVYNEKYEECILKIKQFYASDNDFAQLIADYDSSKGNKIKLTIICSIIGICVVTLAVLLIIGVL